MGNLKGSTKSYKRVLVPYSEEQLAGVFRNHDKDGDGKLTKEDLKQAFHYLGSNFSAFRAHQALRAADSDGDGVITMEELDKLIHYAKRHNYTIC